MIENHPNLISITPIVDVVKDNFIVQVKSQTDKDILNGAADHYRGIPLYESGKLAAGVSSVEFYSFESPASMVVVYKPELKGRSRHNLAAIKVGGDSKPTITKGSFISYPSSATNSILGATDFTNFSLLLH